jgi:type I restriction enzyme S subunit
MKINSWKTVRLGDVCEVIPGYAFKSKDMGEVGIPVVKIGDIKEDLSVDLMNCNRISEDIIDERFDKFILEDKDILLAMTGATAGKMGRLRSNQKALLNQRVAKIKPREADREYVWFVLSTERYRELFYNLGRGAAQPNISGGQIESVEIPLPPLPIQRRIASILSAYDDLIQNNLRRIKLLEESARLLYKEWFVRLRFPGHEHTRIINGVPEGWERKRLGDLAFVVMGQSPKSQFYNEDGEGLPFHQGVSDFGERFVTHSTYCTVSNRIAEPGDILCSVRAPVGRLNKTLDKIVIGRGLAAIRSKSDHQSYLYYQLRHHFFKEDLIGGGAIFASVTKEHLLSQELLTATESLIREFEDVIRPIDRQIELLFMENQKLRQARDILLPKLMNGEIEVDNLSTKRLV